MKKLRSSFSFRSSKAENKTENKVDNSPVPVAVPVDPQPQVQQLQQQQLQPPLSPSNGIADTNGSTGIAGRSGKSVGFSPRSTGFPSPTPGSNGSGLSSEDVPQQQPMLSRSASGRGFPSPRASIATSTPSAVSPFARSASIRPAVPPLDTRILQSGQSQYNMTSTLTPSAIPAAIPSPSANKLVRTASAMNSELLMDNESPRALLTTLTRTQTEFFGNVSQLQQQTMMLLGQRMNASGRFEMLPRQKQERFDAMLGTSGVEVMIWIPKGQTKTKQRKCTLKCNYSSKNLIFDFDGTLVNCPMDSIEGFVLLELFANNDVNKAGLGNQFRICIQGKPHMDVSVENDQVCDNLITALIGTVSGCCSRGPLARAIRQSAVLITTAPSSNSDSSRENSPRALNSANSFRNFVPSPANIPPVTNGVDVSGGGYSVDSNRDASPATYQAPVGGTDPETSSFSFSVEDQLSTTPGLEVELLIPRQPGFGIQNRLGYLRCRPFDKKCYLDVPSFYPNAPLAAAVSFDVNDFLALRPQDGQPLDPSWSLEYTRIARMEIANHNEPLLLQFENPSIRDAFIASFTASMDKRKGFLAKMPDRLNRRPVANTENDMDVDELPGALQAADREHGKFYQNDQNDDKFMDDMGGVWCFGAADLMPTISTRSLVYYATFGLIGGRSFS
jgi:hypothetical protein